MSWYLRDWFPLRPQRREKRHARPQTRRTSVESLENRNLLSIAPVAHVAAAVGPPTEAPTAHVSTAPLAPQPRGLGANHCRIAYCGVVIHNPLQWCNNGSAKGNRRECERCSRSCLRAVACCSCRLRRSLAYRHGGW